MNLIYKWTEEDVWNFINCNLIDYCVLYDRGKPRLGCIGCPLQGALGMERDFIEYPLFKKAYIKSFDKAVENRKIQGKKCKWNSGEEVMEWWIYGNRLEDSQYQVSFDIGGYKNEEN